MVRAVVIAAPAPAATAAAGVAATSASATVVVAFVLVFVMAARGRGRRWCGGAGGRCRRCCTRAAGGGGRRAACTSSAAAARCGHASSAGGAAADADRLADGLRADLRRQVGAGLRRGWFSGARAECHGGQDAERGERAAGGDGCAVDGHGRHCAATRIQPPVQAHDKSWQSLAGAAGEAATLGEVATRILIVEDEASIAEPFARLLEREGFETTVAGTAAAALAAARSERPDLVVLDLALPDGDGRDVCRTLRGESQVPVIMLTARGTETDRVVGLELGADDYVVKPFSAAEMIARIRAVLRRTSAVASTAPARYASASSRSTCRRAARRSPAPSSSSAARSSTCSPSSCATPARSSAARTS